MKHPPDWPFHRAKLSTDRWFYKGGKCGCFELTNKIFFEVNPPNGQSNFTVRLGPTNRNTFQNGALSYIFGVTQKHYPHVFLKRMGHPRPLFDNFSICSS